MAGMFCSHPHYNDGHCAYAPCPNYHSKCPRHSASGSIKYRCSQFHLPTDKAENDKPFTK